MRTTRQTNTRHSGTFAVACATVAALTLVAAPSLRAQENEEKPGWLVQGDGDAGGGFGWSVSVSGDTAVVGAPVKDDFGPISGAAYVFVRSQTDRETWIPVVKLTPSDARTGLNFGSSVAIDGDTIVVGALGHTGDLVELNRAAYIFQRDRGGPNEWGQVAILRPSDEVPQNQFGSSVDIDGDTVIVGAPGLSVEGAAYVFARNVGGADVWGEVQKLPASGTFVRDRFGARVSISGDTVIIGAADAHNPRNTPVYVFTRTGIGPGMWQESARLSPTVPVELFGHELSLDGDTVIIAGSEGQYPFVFVQDLVYVFERDRVSPSQWNETAILHSGVRVRLGGEVSISGDLAVVGLAYSSGIAKVFHRNKGGPGAWGELFRVKSPISPSVGSNVAISGTAAIVGHPSNDRAYACPLETVNYTSGVCRIESQVLNDSFTMSDLTTACCDDDIFTITATFTNTGAFSIQRPYFELTEVSFTPNISFPLSFETGVEEISPGESMTVPFRIPLVDREPFRFFVDLRGQPVQ